MDAQGAMKEPPRNAALFSVEGPIQQFYVRAVLAIMLACERRMGNAQVRISLAPRPTRLGRGLKSRLVFRRHPARVRQ